MKSAKFDYCRPTTLTEALAVLAQAGDDAKVLAGGQSLVPLMNFRLARPALLVDLNQIAELQYIQRTDGLVRIGALTRHRAIERSVAVASACPLLPKAARLIGHAAIRTRGTVGGSIAHADPAAELLAVLAALDGRVVLRSRDSERVVGPEAFFEFYFTTALQPDEIVTEVQWPVAPAERNGSAFLEVVRRHGDFAIAGVAASVALDAHGHSTQVALGLCGVAPTPVKARAAEAVLLGEDPLGRALAEACQLAMRAAEPVSDLHATAEYRREVIGVLTRRAIGEAVAHAKGEVQDGPVSLT